MSSATTGAVLALVFAGIILFTGIWAVGTSADTAPENNVTNTTTTVTQPVLEVSSVLPLVFGVGGVLAGIAYLRGSIGGNGGAY